MTSPHYIMLRKLGNEGRVQKKDLKHVKTCKLSKLRRVLASCPENFEIRKGFRVDRFRCFELRKISELGGKGFRHVSLASGKESKFELGLSVALGDDDY